MTRRKRTKWGQGRKADRTVGATAALNRAVVMVMVALLAVDVTQELPSAGSVDD